MKQAASARKSSRSNVSFSPSSGLSEAPLVVCIRNQGFEASLELRKIYPTVVDAAAHELGLLRVVDESGDDYLYPEGNFLPVVLPLTVRRAVLAAA